MVTLLLYPAAGGVVQTTLIHGEQIFQTVQNIRSASILAHIDQLLAAHMLSPQDLTGVGVVMAEGAFTGTRIASVIANTIAYVQDIPVVPLTSDHYDQPRVAAEVVQNAPRTFLSPTYSGMPNIRGPANG